MITPVEETFVYHTDAPAFSKKLKREKLAQNPFVYIPTQNNLKKDKLFKGILANQESDSIISICAFCISPDQKRVAVGTPEGDIFVSDLESNDFVQFVSAHTARISSVVFLKDKILSCGHDQTVKVFDLEGHHLFSFQHDGWVNECRVGRNENVAVSCSNDNTAKLWDLKTGKCLLVLRHNSMVYACGIFTPLDPLLNNSNTRIITGDRIGNLSLFDFQGQCLQRISFEDDYIFYQSCSFSSDGKSIAIGTFQGYIRILDSNTLQIQKQGIDP